MLAAPARERVSLVIADMGYRRIGIDRLQAAEGHDLPFAVDLAPMPRRLPFLMVGGGKAVHQPQRRLAVAAICHEGLPLGIADEMARQSDGADQRAVHRLLIVEMK